ncbi:acyltransferase family protein [Aurantibacter sp.]|uniref:acyltransferase family protein n=1 Tax=Aurantibacter sp. TaxID=2807103 RepID=UPI0032672995
MERNKNRLYFIDAMRAWAILMMLQGHFIDGLLADAFRDNSNIVYSIWKYFRGITAPIFFTVSGFIFTYLLIKVPQKGFDNPRIKKGIRRGVQLIFIGYLLRSNIFGLLQGKIYHGFLLVDVLHCIGLSILGIIAIYLLTSKSKKWLLSIVLLATTLLLFAFEPLYKSANFAALPNAIANYFSKANGSVFTIIPWFGYASFGAFLSVLFYRYRESAKLYTYAIPIAAVAGLLLIFTSSPLLDWLYVATDIQLFNAIALNNYLFIRLGDVLVAFALFMLARKYVLNATFLRIGQNTLSIYVIHFIILYGSFTGLGLYRFFNHALNPVVVIVGAIAFMITCSYMALLYDKHEVALKSKLAVVQKQLWRFVETVAIHVQRVLKAVVTKTLQVLGFAKN